MNKLITAIVLLAATSTAVAQSYTHRAGVTTSRYPVHEQRAERQAEECWDEVVEDNRPHPLAFIIGSGIGYAVVDYDRRHYTHVPRHGYVLGRGEYYNDRGRYLRHEGRVARYHGAAAGGLIASQYGRSHRIQRRCEPSGHTYYRNVLIGYRIVSRYPDGTTRERFEPIRDTYGY